MNSRKILILQGHPDTSMPHLGHALADAYAAGAEAAGHSVRRIDIGAADFAPLTSAEEFRAAGVPPEIKVAQEAIRWADHVTLIFPLWLGGAPAKLRAFFEQVMRPGFAFEYEPGGTTRKLLRGRSAHLIVTMGMPAFLYRWYFGAFGVRAIERSILGFVGFGPIRRTLLGRVETCGKKTRAGWFGRMALLGQRGE